MEAQVFVIQFDQEVKGSRVHDSVLQEKVGLKAVGKNIPKTPSRLQVAGLSNSEAL